MKKVIIPIGIIGLIVIVSVVVGHASSTERRVGSAAATPGQAIATPAAGSKYKDGTYSAHGSYQSPEGDESIGVSITVASNSVQSVSITPEGQGRGREYEQLFAQGIGSIVQGQPLSSNFDVSEVNGSSLTGAGFNQALQSIRAQAQG
jgi:uncharacterized protein with FMN-binding domain